MSCHAVDLRGAPCPSAVAAVGFKDPSPCHSPENEEEAVSEVTGAGL